MSTPLPRTITNVPGRLGTVTDNVLLSGLNVVGCDQANIMGMYGTILEPFLDKGGRAILVGDNNHVAGLAVKNPAHAKGLAYDVITLGHGNDGAEIHADEGDLIAELALSSNKTVVLNLAGMSRLGVRSFLHDFANTISRADVQEVPTLLGYTEQSRHYLRQHTGSTKTTRETQFMNGRLRDQNIRQFNAVGAIQDVPTEFNMSIPNIVAMVQTSSKGRYDLARHLGVPHRARIIAEQATPDCGVAFAGVNHGSLFNASDLDPNGPYVMMVEPTRSLFGTVPSQRRTLNKSTLDFMKRLKDARQARKEAKAQAAADKIVSEATASEERRLLQKAGRDAARARMMNKAGSVRSSKTRRCNLPQPGLRNRLTEGGLGNISITATSIIGLAQYEHVTGIKMSWHATDAVVEFARTDEMKALVRKTNALAARSELFLYGAWAVAYATLSKIDAVRADAFFDQLLKGADRKSCGQVLLRRLKGLTDSERTTHRVLDYVFQAWSAFSAGRDIDHFVDNEEVSVHHAEIVQIRGLSRAAA